MLDTLKTYFGYDTFRPMQKEVIQTVLQKNDALVLMPTGSGKSLCYQLPALLLPGITVVISPLIALMKDQVDALTASGVPAAFLNSTLTPKKQDEIQAQALLGEVKILFLAPERLASPQFQQFLKKLQVSLIAIDEAHCISEWGHDFRPEYRNLRSLRTSFPDVPVIALTATATMQVQQDISRELAMQNGQVFLSSFNRPNLSYTVQPKYQAASQLIDMLKPLKGESAIVYCFSRKDTEAMAQHLCDAGLKALPYHAGLNRETRKETQEKFIRDETPIIVATIAFGMGINKPNVRLVAHMDLPKSIEAYYQETGRAGRDGLPSECVLFYTFADRRKHEYFIRQSQNEQERALLQQKLSQVTDYCELHSCRRQFLLEYFGEHWEQKTCDACDNCTAPDEDLHDATEVAQKILSAVLRTGERFGAAHVCDVLRGSNKKRIRDLGHNRLSVFGILQIMPVQEVREFVQLLLQERYLEKNEGEYPTLRVSAKGKNALMERSAILLAKPSPILSLKKREKKTGAEFDANLFEQLRALRKRLADDAHIPPFVIFGDRSLQEMAGRMPQNLETFGEIFGVGKAKLEQYGELFVQCVQNYAKEHGIELVEQSATATVRIRKPSSVTRADSTFQKTKALLEKKHSIEEMARMRDLSHRTILSHIQKLQEEGEELDIDYLKPSPERLTAIQKAFEETGNTFLSPAREKLGESYSYDEINLARLFL